LIANVTEMKIIFFVKIIQISSWVFLCKQTCFRSAASSLKLRPINLPNYVPTIGLKKGTRISFATTIICWRHYTI
jgi:hypothetical protein